MPSCIGEPSAGESVRPREMSVPSDGGEEVIAPRVPPVPAKPTQAEQDEHYATGHAAYRAWCEHCVKRSIVTEGELPEVGYHLRKNNYRSAWCRFIFRIN